MDEAEASDEEQQAWEKAQAKRAMAGSNRHEKDEEDDKEVYIPAPSESSNCCLHLFPC